MGFQNVFEKTPFKGTYLSSSDTTVVGLCNQNNVYRYYWLQKVCALQVFPNIRHIDAVEILFHIFLYNVYNFIHAITAFTNDFRNFRPLLLIL